MNSKIIWPSIFVILFIVSCNRSDDRKLLKELSQKIENSPNDTSLLRQRIQLIQRLYKVKTNDENDRLQFEKLSYLDSEAYIKNNGTDGSIYHAQAIIDAFKYKNYPKAIGEVNKAIALGLPSYSLRYMINVKMGKYENALSDLLLMKDKLIEKVRMEVIIDCYIYNNQLHDVINLYKDQIDTLFNEVAGLDEHLLVANKPQKALRWLNPVTWKINDDSVFNYLDSMRVSNIIYKRGLAFYELNNYDSAKYCFHSSIQYNATNFMSAYYLSKLFYMNKDVIKGQYYFDMAVNNGFYYGDLFYYDRKIFGQDYILLKQLLLKKSNVIIADSNRDSVESHYISLNNRKNAILGYPSKWKEYCNILRTMDIDRNN